MSMVEETWFGHIRRPSRYLGNEFNVIEKDLTDIEVSVALAFPDIYEVGMSHLGLKILYHTLNQHEWLSAERVFCPWVDLERELAERKLPLRTLESGRPLSEFDIIGFSLQHELSFTNVLTMLALCGIPFLSEDRDDCFPLIIAGGPACFNPEPVAPIFDAIVIGDGEETASTICRRVREAKRHKLKTKEDILSELKSIRGVYLPSLFRVSYKEDGTIHAIEPSDKSYNHVEKAIVPDIDQYPFPHRQVVPFTEAIHDRLAVEISRGCTRGCRFCQAGMIYRPPRERNPDSVIEHVEMGLRFTGYGEISLLSLSSGDYCSFGQLLKELMDRGSGDKIAISLPSLRVDSLDPEWLGQIKRVRKTGFTLAPEAGNDRLRRIINKPLTNSEILNISREVYEAGWNLIKLYFMIGLPDETDSDLQDIVQLARSVSRHAGAKGKRAKLNISVATFVPKSHTPFMWMPQIPLQESQRRIGAIREGLKHSRVRIKWNDPELSWLEGIFSRGDRRLAKVLLEAWRLGARFDAWHEHFKMDLWEKAFHGLGLDPSFYLHRSRSVEELLPWDHIRSGVKKGYLKREWDRALKMEATPDCRERCHDCGVCDHSNIDPVLHRDWAPSPGTRGSPVHQRSGEIKKYRITFSKTGWARYLSHLELVRLFIRAFRRGGLNLAYSQGYHPMPKISFASALPVGMESLHENVDIKVYGDLSIMTAKEEINRQLVEGIEVTQLEEVTGKARRSRLLESHFHITMNGWTASPEDLERFLQSDVFPVTKSDNRGIHTINARPMVLSMNLVGPNGLDLVMTHVPGPELRPTDIIRGVFHLNDRHVSGIRVLKTRQVIG